VFEDPSGSIVFGRVSSNVLYAGFKGSLSAGVGMAFADRLLTLAKSGSTVRYFADASSLTAYDVLARSAFVRAVLSERRRFIEIVLLTWVGGVSAATQAFADAIGQPLDILTQADEFRTRLVRAAPTAELQLDPRAWVSAGSCSAAAARDKPFSPTR
jgi:hypothetical protein